MADSGGLRLVESLAGVTWGSRVNVAGIITEAVRSYGQGRYQGDKLKFSEMESIDAGLKFKTIGGLMVETTGVTVHVESTEVYVHEVQITEGVGEGNKYLHNLDSAEPLS